MDSAGFTIGGARYGGTRHPFRATLPRRVLRSLPELEPEVARRLMQQEAMQESAENSEETSPLPRRGLRLTAQEVKDFLLAYTACLVAVLAYLG